MKKALKRHCFQKFREVSTQKKKLIYLELNFFLRPKNGSVDFFTREQLVTNSELTQGRSTKAPVINLPTVLEIPMIEMMKLARSMNVKKLICYWFLNINEVKNNVQDTLKTHLP